MWTTIRLHYGTRFLSYSVYESFFQDWLVMRCSGTEAKSICVRSKLLRIALLKPDLTFHFSIRYHYFYFSSNHVTVSSQLKDIHKYLFLAPRSSGQNFVSYKLQQLPSRYIYDFSPPIYWFLWKTIFFLPTSMLIPIISSEWITSENLR